MIPKRSQLNLKASIASNTFSIVKNYKMIVLQAGILLAVTSMIFYQDLALIFGKAVEFTEGNITNYVLTIPFLIGIIIYRKRNVILAVASLGDRNHSLMRLDDVLGITLCVVSMLLYVYGSQTLYSLEWHTVSLTMFLAGGTALLFNLATLRHVIIGIMLTLYLQPPPGQLVSEIAADLSWSIAVLVQSMLSTFGMPITLDSTQGAPALVVVLPQGDRVPFFVGEPSSGVFSTIGLSLFALFVAYIIRGPFWKRIVLFIMGFPIFFILNALRIAIILVLWYFWGQQVAETYHLVSGSLMVAFGTIAILTVAEKVFRLNIRSPRIKRNKCPICDKSLNRGESLCLYCGLKLKHSDRSWKLAASRTLILVFLCAIVIGGSLTVAETPSQTKNPKMPDRLSELDISTIKGPETTSYFLPQIPGWELRYAYRDSRIESVLNQDAALAFRYALNSTGQNDNNNDNFTIQPYVYVSVQISTGYHTWKDSLVTYPSRVGRPGATIFDDSTVDISKNLQGTFMQYQRVGSKTDEAVVYWFERAPLKFGSNYQERNILLSVWSNTNLLARSGLISNPDDVNATKQLYLTFAKQIKEYWNVQFPQASNSKTVYSFIRDYIGILVIAVTIPAIIVTIYQAMKKLIVERRANQRLYNSLPASDKLFLQSFLSLPLRERLRTGKAVAMTYEKLTGKNLNEDEVLEKLELAQKSGLIKRKIASSHDDSLLVWRPAFKYVTDSMNARTRFSQRSIVDEIRSMFQMNKRKGEG